MSVRLMGGTILMRHFPPSRADDAIELLPPGATDAASFLRSLDCFFYRTSPRWFEVAGRVVAEAMACGLPVVCSREIGFAELITHGQDGFLFDDNDDDAALAYMVRLAGDAQLRRNMGEAARRTAEAKFGTSLHERIRAIFLGR